MDKIKTYRKELSVDLMTIYQRAKAGLYNFHPSDNAMLIEHVGNAVAITKQYDSYILERMERVRSKRKYHLKKENQNEQR